MTTQQNYREFNLITQYCLKGMKTFLLLHGNFVGESFKSHLFISWKHDKIIPLFSPPLAEILTMLFHQRATKGPHGSIAKIVFKLRGHQVLIV